MIKKVPTYAKFLKDMCTVKKGLGIEKKAFLTEQVKAIIQSKTPVKYKDPGSPTMSVNIRGTCIDKALLDLGASVNLLPYSIYKKLGLGELKHTNITLSLADRSVKIPKGIVEDVLVKVDKFYYPVDFVVLDTEPIASGPNHVPIILGIPFLATSNAIINCRNGVMQLIFGNMTLELNIFHLSNKNKLPEDDMQGYEEVCSVGPSVREPKAHSLQVTGPDPDTPPGFPGLSHLVEFHYTIPRKLHIGTPPKREVSTCSTTIPQLYRKIHDIPIQM